MNRTLTLAVMSLLLIGMLVYGAGSLTRSMAQPENPGQVTICHATTDQADRYIEVTISRQGRGHEDHELDIIPAPPDGCPNDLSTLTPTPTATFTPSPTPTSTPSPTPTPDPLTVPLPRATTDRPDDLPSDTNQIHIMYVLPSDGADRQLDTNGTLTTSVLAWNHWLSEESGGFGLALDTFAGSLDITFYRLERTDAEISDTDPNIRDELEAELQAAGFADPNKIYAVYYDGSSDYACGGGAWPPTKPGQVAAMYLQGEPVRDDGTIAHCDQNPFASTIENPGYMEYAMLHEILHTIGIVAVCAPHHTDAGHTSDSPTDLMYAGDQPWDPDKLDVGDHDYFDHNNDGCLDLLDSGWLMSTP